MVDSAICTVPCPGFVQGDCLCHDAGPWAMWICMKKDGAFQAQPWFCSQPTCGCNGGGNPSTSAAHAGNANASVTQARVAGRASPTPAETSQVVATFPASTTPPEKAAATPPCSAQSAPTASQTPAGTPQPPATSAPPTVTTAISLTKAAPKAAAVTTETTRDVAQRRQYGKVHLPEGLRIPCAPLPTPSHRFLVHACAWVDPGTPCLVQCNASAGWHGAASIFWCPAGNADGSQMAVPWTTWPNCTQSIDSGSVHVKSSGFKHVQRSFLESSSHLRQRVHSSTAVLLGVAVFVAMVSLLSLCWRSRSQQAEAQHFLGTTLENQE